MKNYLLIILVISLLIWSTEKIQVLEDPDLTAYPWGLITSLLSYFSKVRNQLEVKNFSTINGTLLHTAFHYNKCKFIYPYFLISLPLIKHIGQVPHEIFGTPANNISPEKNVNT